MQLRRTQYRTYCSLEDAKDNIWTFFLDSRSQQRNLNFRKKMNESRWHFPRERELFPSCNFSVLHVNPSLESKNSVYEQLSFVCFFLILSSQKKKYVWKIPTNSSSSWFSHFRCPIFWALFGLFWSKKVVGQKEKKNAAGYKGTRKP